MKNIFSNLKNFSAYSYFILISIVLIFDRSAVGIYISGIQLGKLMIGLSLILTIVFLTFPRLQNNSSNKLNINTNLESRHQ